MSYSPTNTVCKNKTITILSVHSDIHDMFHWNKKYSKNVQPRVGARVNPSTFFTLTIVHFTELQ